MLLSITFLTIFSSSATAIFYAFSTNSTLAGFTALRDDIKATSLQDDIVTLIATVINKTQPTSIAFITDSIYECHIQRLIPSISNKVIFSMSIKDSETFDYDPPEKLETMLKTMKSHNCDLYVILITNGIQMVSFLQFTDHQRLLNTKSNVMMLHDYRLFIADLHYIWKRIVNVIFVRRCDTKQRIWYEMSTVPFPKRIHDVFVSRTLNFWSPFSGFRWPGSKFNGKSARGLNGVELKVAVLPHTPTVFKSNSVNASYTGLEIDLITALSHVMNFSTEFYEPADAESEKWGRQVGEGNFSGLLREMDEANADIALGDIHYTMYHLAVMDLSTPYNTECLTFITPEVLSDNSWKTLLLPFSLGMWIGVLVSLFCVGVIFFTVSNVYRFIKSRRKSVTFVQPPKLVSYFARDFFDSLSACILYTFSMLLVVSLPSLPLRWSVRVLTGWWWIYCILVVVAYRASLTSILANPQPRLTIDTLEVLAKSWLKCGAWGDENKNFFVTSTDPAAQKIGTKIEHVDNAGNAIIRVTEGDFAYFENTYTLQQLRFECEQKESAQNLHIMNECAINMPISIGLDKNSPLKEQIDKNIGWAIEGGLIQKWMMQATKSFESSIELSPPEALMDLKKFYGALFALACGYALALIAFAIEKIYWKLVVERHPNYDKYYGNIKAAAGRNT